MMKRYFTSQMIFMRCLLLIGFILSAICASAQTFTTTQNFVVETRVKTPKQNVADLNSLVVDSANRTVQYFDGLGRLLQTVEWQGSPKKRDLVTPVAYDAFGRAEKKYLPYSATVATSTGGYKTTAITDQNSFYTTPGTTSGWASGGVVPIPGAAFSKTIFELGPLDRVQEQGAPGSVYQPAARSATTGRTVVLNYGTNNALTLYSTTGYAVRLFKSTASTVAGESHKRVLSSSGNYPANELFLTVAKDENWTGTPAADAKLGSSEEYKDKEGRILLKRTFNKVGTTVQVLSTYYVYDELDNLSFVLPPAANGDAGTPTQAILDNLCYQYRHDHRNRLMEKRIPGKGDWDQIIYNPLDQVVFTQDPAQRAAGSPGPYRSFIKYDGQGRIIMTGVESGQTGSHASVQNTVNTWHNPHWDSRDASGIHGYTNLSIPGNTVGMDIQVVNYYDDYNIPGIPDNQSTSYSKMTSGLLTATKTKVLGSANHYLWTINYYDDEGRVVRVWEQHYKGGTVAANSYDEITNTYNFAGEMTASVRRHFVAGVEKLHVANRFTYDHMGRPKDTYQKTGDVVSTANKEILLSRKTYNEVGQLSVKQLHAKNLTTPVFAQTITYGYNARGWLKSSGSTWFNQTLNYEEVISGVAPQYNGNISRQLWGPAATPSLHNFVYSYDNLNRLTLAKSDEGKNETIGYDLLGNITRLKRDSSATVSTDRLRYDYTNGRLTQVYDSVLVKNPAYQLPLATTYAYNTLNGNLTSRSNVVKNNNLSNITYNHLNLPVTLTVGDGATASALTYTYDADGNKLKKLVTGANALNNEYINGIHYENGVLKFVQTTEGRVLRSSATDYKYEYAVGDHLGNGRVYFEVDTANVATRKQEVDYYAFGLEIERQISSPKNLYLYNGKEKQEHEKLFDYGARFYDPVVARWNVIDPLAENHYEVSAFAYVVNNPINFIDPFGLDTVKPNQIVPPAPDVRPFDPKVDVIELNEVGVTSKSKSSVIDDLQTTLDAIGVADPTGIADGVNAVIHLSRGNYGDAAISAIAIIPYVGDLAKGAKYGTKFYKAYKSLDKVRKTMQIHHRIPQKYIKNGLFPKKMLTSLSNLQGLPTEIHQKVVTPAWNAFMKANPNASRAEVMKFAIEMDKTIAQHINTIGR
ncbi:MAG TPA: DUF6443 domain-containing protein [Pedobacter sp.]|nr:DUF6443 domain-containing protein [Pedobacter sp.]